MQRCGFEATGLYRAEHTALQRFVTPAAAALWNMRWQVRGFVDAIPDATDAQLAGRFTVGSGLRAGGLRELFYDESWEDQLVRFGEVLLLAAFALYEGWVAELRSALRMSEVDGSALIKALTSATPNTPGEKKAIAALSKNPSAVAQTQIQPGLRAGAHARPLASASKLLKAMRGYKAARNALAHRGGILTPQDVAAIHAAMALTAADVGTRAAPDFLSVLSNGRVRVTYRNAIGCTAILLKIVMTIDAELGGSLSAEEEAIRRIRQHPRLRQWRFLPADGLSRASRVQQLLIGVGLPPAAQPLAFAEWLKERGLLTY